MEKLTNADLKWLDKFVPNADLSITTKTETRSAFHNEGKLNKKSIRKETLD